MKLSRHLSVTPVPCEKPSTDFGRKAVFLPLAFQNSTLAAVESSEPKTGEENAVFCSGGRLDAGPRFEWIIVWG